jgi:choline-glycine betaine transporter
MNIFTVEICAAILVSIIISLSWTRETIPLRVVIISAFVLVVMASAIDGISTGVKCYKKNKHTPIQIA